MPDAIPHLAVGHVEIEVPDHLLIVDPRDRLEHRAAALDRNACRMTAETIG